MSDALGGNLSPRDRGFGDGDVLPDAATAPAAPAAPPMAPTYTDSASRTDVSRTDVAKEQAGQLGETARDSGQRVASTAGDEAGKVVHETRRQAADLSREVGSQVSEQASVQKDKATASLRSLSDELRSMAQNGEKSGPATDLAHQAADKLGDAAQWLDRHEPGHLVEEVRDLARRRPGTFLLTAAAAGVLVGRLTRGAVQAARSDDQPESITPYADPAPAPSAAASPQSGSFAGESYPTAETDVLVVEDSSVPSAYGAGTR